MTFLQLARRLRQEVLASGTGPSAVTNQVGELQRIVDWIATSDEDVQRMHNQWKFMVGDFTIDTVAGDNSYAASDCVTPVTNLRDWKRDSFKLYLLANGTADEIPLVYLPYSDWYRIYNTGSQTNSRPFHFTIGNDMSIKVGPTPDAVYRISGEYQKSVTTMTGDSDTPAYPAEYHMLAVYRGMMKYGRSTGAIELYQDGEKEYNRMLNEMELTQLPELELGGPLA